MVRIGELPKEYRAESYEDALGPEDVSGKEITITAVETREGKNGRYGIFLLVDSETPLKTGGVFFNQMKKIEEANLLPVTGFVVAHNTGKANPYYTLEDKLEG